MVSALPYEGTDRWALKLKSRFRESEAAGLIALAAAKMPPHTDASILFWRDIAAGFLQALCHLPQNQPFTHRSLSSPDTTTLSEWILNAPPMQGAEYLTQDTLRNIWIRLVDWTVTQSRQTNGLNLFLKKNANKWSRVGRVTVHLAENKGDSEYPFAFMATYAAGLTHTGRIQRLPLGQALKEYAGANKKPELLKLLSPLHNTAKHSTLIADLIQTGDIFHPLVWTPAEAYEFLREIPIYEENGLLTQLPNWWRKRTRPRIAVTLDNSRNSTMGKDALLDFNMSMVLGDQQLSNEETQALLNASEGLMLLRGEWVEVDNKKLRQALEHWEHVEKHIATDGVSFIQGMRMLAGASADLKDDEFIKENDSWSFVEAGHSLRQALENLRTPAGLTWPQPADFHGELRHYQLDGLNWLWLCSRLGVGACLADDMGLGKTIQILALLLRYKKESKNKKQKTTSTAAATRLPAHKTSTAAATRLPAPKTSTAAATRLPAKDKNKPTLLIIPASLIGNWKSETTRFAPNLNLLIAHSAEQTKTALTKLADNPKKQLKNIDLVITTYSMVARLDWLQTIDWNWIILDEAQAIKNPTAKQTKATKKLKATSCIALTGTPVENRLGDLWSIFDFLNPGLLGTATRFKQFAKDLENREHARYAPLRNLVTPYILRRMKTDPEIASDLPEKTEMQVFCGLAKPQAVLYQQSVNDLTKALNDPTLEGIKRRGLVLSYLMRFKQICNHPSQLTGSDNYEPTASAKFARLQELCTEIASRGEKALIFTQFRIITEPLAEFLTTIFGRDGLILHGGTPIKHRKQLVEKFQREDGPPFFVLSIKAGGTGLNLTEASHVIHFDRWWNPAVENQATDRAFRIGQQRNVLVHKFVTRGTIEEKIDNLIREKQDMANALLEGGGEKTLTEMTNNEIINMVSLDIERTKV